MIARHVGRVHCCLLRGKWRTFTRSAEAERARTLPRDHVSSLIRNGDDRVIERGLNVHDSVRNVLALFLLELLLLAFFLRRCAGSGCCWFCHVSVLSSRWSVLGCSRRYPSGLCQWLMTNKERQFKFSLSISSSAQL